MRTVENAIKIDQILKYLLENGGHLFASTIQEKIFKDLDIEKITLLLVWIEQDFSDYVNINKVQGGFLLQANIRTHYFLENGGAEEFVKSALVKQEYDTIQLEVSKSVIATNKSVIDTNTALVDINRKMKIYSQDQRNASYVIAAFTLITTFTSVVTVWKACEEPDKLKIEPVRMSQTQLDSTLRFQKGIDSSLEIMVKKIDSSNILRKN